MGKLKKTYEEVDLQVNTKKSEYLIVDNNICNLPLEKSAKVAKFGRHT